MSRGRAFIAIVSCCAVAACTQPAAHATQSPCDQPANQVITVPNVGYVRTSAEKLDLYLPWHKAGEPLVVFAHGGGWAGGDKQSYGHIGRYFAACGIAFANVNYPLAPHARADGQANALLDAAQWLAARAPIFGFAGDRLFLAGDSAGAEIAALAALDPRLQVARRGLNIRGVVALSGLGYAPSRAAEAGALPPYIVRYYTAAFGADERRWARYDMPRVPHAPGPPFLIVRGADDRLAPQADSAEFARALRQSGTSVEYIEAPERDHSTTIADIARDSADPIGLAVERFIFTAVP